MSEANLARIYRETSNRLEVLSRRVAEDRDVMTASEFCRWLLGSGIVSLLEAFSNDERFPSLLKIDGKHLRWKTDELLARCNERFARNDHGVKFEASSFETLHEKIDKMAGYLSRLSVAPAVSVAPFPAQEFEQALAVTPRFDHSLVITTAEGKTDAIHESQRSCAGDESRGIDGLNGRCPSR